jgi:osmotically-inducible protein OsmY
VNYRKEVWAVDKTRDTVLRQAVAERLLNNSATADAAIEVVSLGEQVTLIGVVNSMDVKTAAEVEAKSVPGVIQVINELEVRSGDDRDDPLQPPPIVPHRQV